MNNHWFPLEFPEFVDTGLHERNTFEKEFDTHGETGSNAVGGCEGSLALRGGEGSLAIIEMIIDGCTCVSAMVCQPLEKGLQSTIWQFD